MAKARRYHEKDGQEDMQELMGDVEVNPIETDNSSFQIFKVEED